LLEALRLSQEIINRETLEGLPFPSLQRILEQALLGEGVPATARIGKQCLERCRIDLDLWMERNSPTLENQSIGQSGA
jgi:hypothetical protein